MTLLEWHDKEFLATVDAAVEVASREGAELVEKDMKRLVPVDTGELRNAIKIKKSKFRDGGYIVGVFENNPPADFGKSLGAKALSVEYGHAGPGAATSATGKRIKGAAKVARPRPFIKPALHKNKRRIQKIFQDNLK